MRWLCSLGLILVLGLTVYGQAPAPTLSETQKLKAELVVSKLQRVDAQLTALQAQLALVAGERDRLQGEARAMEADLIAALGGQPGDRLDWQTLTLIKAAPPPVPPKDTP